MPAKTKSLKNATIFAVFLFIIWGLYRYLFKLPDEVEELLIKPIVWLLPVIYFLKQEKASISSLGLTTKNLFPAIYFSLGLGVIFVLEALLVNFVKYSNFNFASNIGELPLLSSLGLSFATAFSEEIAFRGYIFNRVWYALGSEWLANIITSLAWSIIHLPVTIFVWNLTIQNAAYYLFLTMLFGIGSAFVFARTKNVFSSILLHVLWEWPIILFR